MNTLVIDIGGTKVKLKVNYSDEVRRIPTGPYFTAEELVEVVKQNTADWNYEAVSMGYPGPVVGGKITKEPVNLGPGWMHFDFSALGKPFKITNDAAMQALGSYEGGRMLFLGLGTGLGSTLILDGTVVAMELGHMPYKKGKTFEDYVGEAALIRLGRKKWHHAVVDVVAILKAALVAEYVVLGGGNVKKLHEMPPDCRPGDNANAFKGGVRMWEK
jgi:polyphosphate glucokinase